MRLRFLRVSPIETARDSRPWCRSDRAWYLWLRNRRSMDDSITFLSRDCTSILFGLHLRHSVGHRLHPHRAYDDEQAKHISKWSRVAEESLIGSGTPELTGSFPGDYDYGFAGAVRSHK